MGTLYHDLTCTPPPALPEAGLQRDLQTATDTLASRIARQRTGKAEWGWRTNAAALTAMQLYHRSWCFDSLENQRSVDRMEIGLLAAISRYGGNQLSRSPEFCLIKVTQHAAQWSNESKYSKLKKTTQKCNCQAN